MYAVLCRVYKDGYENELAHGGCNKLKRYDFRLYVPGEPAAYEIAAENGVRSRGKEWMESVICLRAGMSRLTLHVYDLNNLSFHGKQY